MLDSGKWSDIFILENESYLLLTLDENRETTFCHFRLDCNVLADDILEADNVRWPNAITLRIFDCTLTLTLKVEIA